MSSNIMHAAFAGGCFWCMVGPFETSNGVLDVKAGYTGGHEKNPTYEKVCSGSTGHYEAVLITYDSTKISYDKLLEIFWHQIDPTDESGQFHDRGEQYMTAIFYYDNEQKRLAEASKQKLEASGRFQKVIATKILSASEFFPA